MTTTCSLPPTTKTNQQPPNSSMQAAPFFGQNPSRPNASPFAGLGGHQPPPSLLQDNHPPRLGGNQPAALAMPCTRPNTRSPGSHKLNPEESAKKHEVLRKERSSIKDRKVKEVNDIGVGKIQDIRNNSNKKQELMGSKRKRDADDHAHQQELIGSKRKRDADDHAHQLRMLEEDGQKIEAVWGYMQNVASANNDDQIQGLSSQMDELAPRASL
jgi:hypothetical protein